MTSSPSPHCSGSTAAPGVESTLSNTTSTTSLFTFEPLVVSESPQEVLWVVLAVVNMLLGCYIIVANVWVVWWYVGKVGQVVPLLFTFIASNDILTGSYSFSDLEF